MTKLNGKQEGGKKTVKMYGLFWLGQIMDISRSKQDLLKLGDRVVGKKCFDIAPIVITYSVPVKKKTK